MRAVRLRRRGSAWTAASNASRLGCWALQLTAGQRSGAGATPPARDLTTQRAWRTWRPCPHGKRTTRRPRWSITRQTPHATSPWVSPRRARGRSPFPGPPTGDLGGPSVGSSPFGTQCPLLLIAAPLPALLWLSALLPLPPPLLLLVQVPPTSASSPPYLSPSSLLCSLPMPLPIPRPCLLYTSPSPRD